MTNFKVGLKKVEVHLDNGSRRQLSELKVIYVKKLCYVWDQNCQNFFKLVGLDEHNPCSELHKYNGLTEKEQVIQ